MMPGFPQIPQSFTPNAYMQQLQQMQQQRQQMMQQAMGSGRAMGMMPGIPMPQFPLFYGQQFPGYGGGAMGMMPNYGNPFLSAPSGLLGGGQQAPARAPAPGASTNPSNLPRTTGSLLISGASSPTNTPTHYPIPGAKGWDTLTDAQKRQAQTDWNNMMGSVTG